MRLCEEKVKSGGSPEKIGSDLLFANVRIRFAIRTYSLAYKHGLQSNPKERLY